MEYLEKFKKLGFNCFEPTGKDNTYYFVKHIEKGGHTAQIWIVMRKTPIVSYKYDYKDAVLPKSLEETIGEFLGTLGYETYRVE